MHNHRYPITLTGTHRGPDGLRRRCFRLVQGGVGRLAYLHHMDTTKLGLEPLIGVGELAEYLGVPVQTIFD